MTDGTATITAVDNGGSYEYVNEYVQTYSNHGKVLTSITGMQTQEADMPTSGVATYTGKANAVLSLAEDINLSDGTSTVTANFGSGRVDVLMTDFTATNSETGALVTDTVDTIKVYDTKISGSNFTNGKVFTSRDGQTYGPNGGIGFVNNSGAFFGHDPTISAPDEVGGAFSVYGSHGSVVGTYVAD